MPFVFGELTPDRRAQGRLCSEETIDLDEPTDGPRIAGIQCQGEIIEIRIDTIPQERREELRVGLRIEARERHGQFLDGHAQHPAQTEQMPSMKVGLLAPKPQRHGLTAQADASSEFRPAPSTSLEKSSQRFNVHHFFNLAPLGFTVKYT